MLGRNRGKQFDGSGPKAPNIDPVCWHWARFGVGGLLGPLACSLPPLPVAAIVGRAELQAGADSRRQRGGGWLLRRGGPRPSARVGSQGRPLTGLKSAPARAVWVRIGRNGPFGGGSGESSSWRQAAGAGFWTLGAVFSGADPELATISCRKPRPGRPTRCSCRENPARELPSYGGNQ